MDFNVEHYRTEHECIEHWELRRRFLLAHKDKFPVERLLSLAQVFINVEILGCRYPDETMHLVKNLSEGVADEYRERKKTKLQRTFVQASDVAETKAKGVRKRSHADLVKSDSHADLVKSDSHADLVKPNSQAYVPEAKKLTKPIQFIRPGESAGPWADGYKSFASLGESSKPEGKVENKIINRHHSLTSIVRNQLSHVIILENIFHDSPKSLTVSRALQINGIPTGDFCRSARLPNGNYCSGYYLNGTELVTSECLKKNDAKENAAEVLLEEMRDFCYTIQIKAPYIVETTVDTQFSTNKKNTEEELPDSNIGNKLLRMMGWSGGGLGKNEQGIAKPVSVQECINRSGLGHTDVKQELRRILHNFARGEFENDIAFSADFTKEERAVIHQLAKKYNLKSKSHGGGDTRQLVISRKETPRALLNRLIQSGGSTEKYNVIKPRNLT